MTQQADTIPFNVTLKLRDEPRLPWAERVFEHIKAVDYLGAMNEAINMAKAKGMIVGKCVSITC